jgi:hypothetical protein
MKRFMKENFIFDQTHFKFMILCSTEHGLCPECDCLDATNKITNERDRVKK